MKNNALLRSPHGRAMGNSAGCLENLLVDHRQSRRRDDSRDYSLIRGDRLSAGPVQCRPRRAVHLAVQRQAGA